VVSTTSTFDVLCTDYLNVVVRKKEPVLFAKNCLLPVLKANLESSGCTV
jgi:hypothetical protein